jgi:hypothetical protein
MRVIPRHAPPRTAGLYNRRQGKYIFWMNFVRFLCVIYWRPPDMSRILRTRGGAAAAIGGALVIALGLLSANATESSGRGATELGAQATATVQATGVSEIGSTNGIVALGIITVMIVVAAVAWHRLAFSREQ